MSTGESSSNRFTRYCIISDGDRALYVCPVSRVSEAVATFEARRRYWQALGDPLFRGTEPPHPDFVSEIRDGIGSVEFDSWCFR